MTALLRALLRLLLAISVAAAAGAATISGTVSDDNGQLLGSMVVAVYDDEGTLAASAGTDGSGFYTLSIAGGTYRVLAYDPAGEYATSFDGGAESFDTSPPLSVTNTSVADVDFRLVRAGVVAGSVILSEGTTREGITVAAYNLSGTQRGFTTTRANGSYSLVLPPGPFKLVAFDDRGSYGTQFFDEVPFFTDAAVVTVTSGRRTSGVDFQLDRAARLTGTVTDAASGALLPAKGVFAYTPSGSLVASTSTDLLGEFSLSLPPGAYRLVAADPNRQYATTFHPGSPSFEASEIVVLLPGGGHELEIALVRGGTISGRITASTGALLTTGVAVAYNLDGSVRASAPAQADGSYVLVVPPGQFKLGAYDASLNRAGVFYPEPSDFRSATRVAVLAGQELSGFDFALPVGGRVAGIVTDAVTHEPLGGITVAAYEESGSQAAAVTTGSDGRYTLVVRPGPYRILAFDSAIRYVTAYAGGALNYDTTLPVTVVAGATIPVDFQLATGVKLGGAVASQRGDPLDGIEIIAYDLAGNRVATAITHGGAFSMVLLADTYKFAANDPESRYGATFYQSAAGWSDATVVVVSEAGVAPLDFVLSASFRRRAVRH